MLSPIREEKEGPSDHVHGRLKLKGSAESRTPFLSSSRRRFSPASRTGRKILAGAPPITRQDLSRDCPSWDFLRIPRQRFPLLLQSTALPARIFELSSAMECGVL